MAEGLAGLPFLAEYAKSGRSSCRKCKGGIENRELRLAVMVQSRMHDGKDAHWHHLKCFFEKSKPASIGLIGNVDNLKWEDQELIRKKIDGLSNGTTTKLDFKEYAVEYAKSGRSGCVACEEKIEKAEVRISKLDHFSETAVMIGGAPLPRYHHVKCFLQVKTDLGFTGTPGQIPGFKNLSKDDQKTLQTQFKAFKPPASGKRKLSEKGNGVPSKVAKQDVDADPSASRSNENDLNSKDHAKMIKQNQAMHQVRDFLLSKFDSKTLRKTELSELLAINGRPTDGIPETLVDRLADVMVFGQLDPCPSCKGQLVFKSGVGYECSGYLSEFTKCGQVTEHPGRKPFAIPDHLKEELTGYSFKKVSDRIIVHRTEAQVPVGSGPPGFVKLHLEQLKGFKIFVSDAIPVKIKERVLEIIEEHKGKAVKRLAKSVVAVVTTAAEMKEETAMKTKALAMDIPVLSVDFISGLTTKTDLVAHMKATLLSEWTVRDNIGELVETLREAVRPKDGENEKKIRRTLEKKEESIRLQMKGGNVVDPECEIANSTHVFQEGKLTYSVVLKRTDIDTNLNSFYKMQLLESDNNRTYHVFRSWGRIGTVVGGQKLDTDINLDEALDIFNEKFTEKTMGNVFGRPFSMKPGGYMLLDISYDKPPEVTLAVSNKSKLAKSVQELVCLIFDVKKMLNTLVEFEIDTKKMPLGKISREQILKAFELLTGLMTELDKKKEPSRMIVDYSNRFFSLIPHNFGLGAIPVLKQKKMVQAKVEMLEQLLDIELAFEMIQGAGDKGSEPVDNHYKRLGALIDPLEKNSGDYGIVAKYLANTHAATHSNYKLNITNVYKVKRGEEDKRSAAFKAMENHQLLWHGSRTTNYAGILSQGLRIAPAEAPVTGYMFGKGIYFADMVSKSANYCYPSSDNCTGLLLLCQVALGTPKEMRNSMDSLVTAPTGFNSVLGLGATRPDPATFVMLEDSVKVPYGLPTASGVKGELLYNEYIVYDPAQVQLRYIVQVDFDYGRRR